MRDVTVVRDEEHNAWKLRIEDRSSGYPRVDHIGADFVTPASTGRSLASYAEVRDVVRALRQGRSRCAPCGAEKEEEPEDEAGRRPRAPPPRRLRSKPPPRRQAPPAAAPRRTATLQMRSLDEFVDHFIELGRKGIAVNRYKGLGEMNPDTLWATTMNPEIRTLLQVKADDHTEADQMFTTLMGDQVEPRRKFIEDNALDVRNLDI